MISALTRDRIDTDNMLRLQDFDIHLDDGAWADEGIDGDRVGLKAELLNL